MTGPNSYDAFPLPEDPSRGSGNANGAAGGGNPPSDGAGPPGDPAESGDARHAGSTKHKRKRRSERRAEAHAHRAGGAKRSRGRRILGAVSLGLVFLLLGGAGYAFYNYQRFVSGVTHVDAIPASDDDDDFDGIDQNILLVGDDHRPEGATDEDLRKIGTESNDGAVNTDTMMLLHLPSDGSAASIISFPRDSWVDVPGFGKQKLNAAYTLGTQEGGASGGAQLLIQTIQNMTGLTVDHYARVSLLGFYNIVDALGPVDVCLNNAVKDPYSTVDLPAGVSTLNAQQALAFVRQRHGLPNGDLDRQVRQQYFLSVEARKILSAGTLLNPMKLGRVLDAVSSSVETDPDLNFLQLASQAKGLIADNITTATIPILGTPTIWARGQELSIVEVDMEAMPDFINSVLGVPSAYETAVAAEPASVTVTVLNGGSTNGAAAAGTEAFTALGFQTGEPSSADVIAVSTIRYPAGQEAAAKAVAATLPAALVEQSADVDGVTVILGADQQIVGAPAPAPVEPDPAVPAPEETPVGTTYDALACIN
jgi:LCP family protein required for cell wall assembly